MKQHLFIVSLMLCGLRAFSQGSLYYFSGHVSTLYYDGGGVLAAQNVAVGDPVSASLIVDFGRAGYFLHNDGTVEVAEWPPVGNVSMEFFYSQFVSGTLIPAINGGLNNGTNDIHEYFVGWNSSGPTGNEGLVQGGSGNSYISIRKSSLGGGTRVQDWVVGTSVRGVLVAYSDHDWSIAWADMRLDSITAAEPTQQIKVSIRDLGDGNMRVGAIGCTPSSQVVLQYSTDCLNWTAVATNTATWNAMSIFAVPKTNSAACFRVYQQ